MSSCPPVPGPRQLHDANNGNGVPPSGGFVPPTPGSELVPYNGAGPPLAGSPPSSPSDIPIQPHQPHQPHQPQQPPPVGGGTAYQPPPAPTPMGDVVTYASQPGGRGQAPVYPGASAYTGPIGVQQLPTPASQITSRFGPALTIWNRFWGEFSILTGWEVVFADRVDAVNTVNSRLRSTNSGRQRHRRTDHYDERYEALRQELAQEQQLRATREKDLETYRSQNDAFRRQIFAMRAGRGPMREEQDYIREFEELKTAIDQGVLKLMRSQGSTPATGVSEEGILNVLSTLGPYGLASYNYFAQTRNCTIAAFYDQRQMRLAFIRHVIALFLFHRVLHPYAAGLSDEVSEALEYIESDLLSRENEFANVLTVHQAMGRGITKLVKSTGDMCEKTQGDLRMIMEQLLPSSPKKSVASYAEKFVDLAIAFKDGIVQEQSLLRVFFCAAREKFQDDQMEVIDDHPSGTVLICTFPGLFRKDPDRTDVIVVKATALLRSSFVPE